MISPVVATVVSVCGSAAIALWLVAIHRQFGPQTLRASLLACAIAWALLTIVQRSCATVIGATDTAVTLLGVVVPSFGFAFWSGGVLIRAFISGPASDGRGAR